MIGALLLAFALQEPAAPPESITLKFAWPERGQAHLTCTQKIGQDQASASEFDLTWKRVEAEGNWEFRLIGAVAAMDEAFAAQLASSFAESASLPVQLEIIIVSGPAGQLLEARAEPRLRKELLTSGAQHQTELERLLEAQWNASGADEWQASMLFEVRSWWDEWLTAWTGSELHLDRVVERTRELQWPRTAGTVLHHEAITCLRFDKDEDGAWLHARLDSASDSDSASAAVLRTIIAEGMTPPADEPVPAVSRKTSVEILTDINTLRPQKILSVTEMRMDGRLLHRTQRRWVFDWSPVPR